MNYDQIFCDMNHVAQINAWFIRNFFRIIETFEEVYDRALIRIMAIIENNPEEAFGLGLFTENDLY